MSLVYVDGNNGVPLEKQQSMMNTKMKLTKVKVTGMVEGAKSPVRISGKAGQKFIVRVQDKHH
jgi:hypothetical protein